MHGAPGLESRRENILSLLSSLYLSISIAYPCEGKSAGAFCDTEEQLLNETELSGSPQCDTDAFVNAAFPPRKSKTRTNHLENRFILNTNK
jgi:hypothetical protein